MIVAIPMPRTIILIYIVKCILRTWDFCTYQSWYHQPIIDTPSPIKCALGEKTCDAQYQPEYSKHSASSSDLPWSKIGVSHVR